METTEQLAIDASDLEMESSQSVKSVSGFAIPFIGNINRHSPDKSEASAVVKDDGRKASKIEVVAGGYTNNRYSHDVEQAKQMRKGMVKRKQLLQQQQQSGKELTETDVRLAFEGLDQAETLRYQGRVQEAFKICELSIELLIQLLKSDEKLLPNVDRHMVGERVQAALTDAEEMKQQLDYNGPRGKLQTVSSQQSQSQSVSRSLTEALNSSKTRKNVVEAVQPPAQTKSRHVQQAAGQFTSSPTKKNSKVATKSFHRQPQPTTRGRTPNTRRINGTSPLANSTDPLVQTIKSELYIDPSQLQSTTWQDIAGLEDAKQALQEAAILPLMRPDLFSGLRKPRNVLLYGPPGTGKTMLVKAVAHESQSLLFICTASAMTSKWLGESEKLIRALFRLAKEAAPSIIFIDEVDALLSARKSEGEHEASRRFKTEFMTQMDGIVKDDTFSDGKHMLVLAATNCPWDIDSAVLRRFPRRIYIPLPDPVTRTALLQKLLENAGDYDISQKDMKAIVKRLDGFSGSDISSVASEASFGPIRSLGGIDDIRGAKSSDIRPIQYQDFDTAIDQATKSVSKKLLKKYDVWKEEQSAS